MSRASIVQNAVETCSFYDSDVSNVVISLLRCMRDDHCDMDKIPVTLTTKLGRKIVLPLRLVLKSRKLKDGMVIDDPPFEVHDWRTYERYCQDSYELFEWLECEGIIAGFRCGEIKSVTTTDHKEIHLPWKISSTSSVMKSDDTLHINSLPIPFSSAEVRSAIDIAFGEEASMQGLRVLDFLGCDKILDTARESFVPSVDEWVHVLTTMTNCLESSLLKLVIRGDEVFMKSIWSPEPIPMIRKRIGTFIVSLDMITRTKVLEALNKIKADYVVEVYDFFRHGSFRHWISLETSRRIDFSCVKRVQLTPLFDGHLVQWTHDNVIIVGEPPGRSAYNPDHPTFSEVITTDLLRDVKTTEFYGEVNMVGPIGPYPDLYPNAKIIRCKRMPDLALVRNRVIRFVGDGNTVYTVSWC